MSCISILIFVVAAVWALLIPWAQITTTFLLSSTLTIPSAVPASLPIVQAALLILPLLPLAFFLKSQILRSAFQTWILSALVSIIFAPIQIIDQSSGHLRSIAGIGSGCFCIALMLFWGRLKDSDNFRLQAKHVRLSSKAITLVLVFSGLYFYPWFIWGALGSFIDTFLAFVSAVVYGFLMAILLERFLFTPLQQSELSHIGGFLVGGIAADIALVIFSSGLAFPFGGTQIMIMLCLSGTAWLAYYLHQYGIKTSQNSFFAITLLFSLAISAPLLFFDSDELALLITASKGEIGMWALCASLISLCITWFSGICILIFQLFHKRLNDLPKTRSFTPVKGFMVVLLTWGLGMMFYFTIGQPGWHGEHLFVILKDQLVVSQAAEYDDYQTRRQLVYTSLIKHANITQAELRSIFDRLGIQYQAYYLVNSIRIDGGPLIRLWLLTRPEVDRVLDNPQLRPLPTESLLSYGNESLQPGLEWNLTYIQADQVWQEFNITGEGIVVGQSDSGVQWDHPELLHSYRGVNGQHDFNWLDPWYHTLEPVDRYGHGTHTLGTIVGSHTGIAPGATWFACANLVRNLGNPAFYLDCMQFMLAPYPMKGDPFSEGDPSRGAHIINNSWNCPDMEGCDADTFLYAVRNLNAAGIFVVASASNDGPRCSTLKYPLANYTEAFTVGAIDQMGELAIFSSIGPSMADGLQTNKPDLVAPGVDILSSTPGNTYDRYSGTSMAGPHVTGVVALIWSANPKLIGDIQTTKQILIESASPYTGMLPDCPSVFGFPSTAIGYGVLNAYEAIKLALLVK